MIERQKKLIKLFLNNPYTYLNANEIANYLNVSNRTVRNDIKTINNEFDNALIMSVKSRGFVLNTQEYEVESLHETLTPLIEKDSKIIINLGYKLLMSNKYFTLNALEKEYHLSKRELMNYLMRLQIWCEKFKVNIEIKKKKGISVVGSISNITNAILHLNQLSDDNDNVEQLILNELPKAHVETIFTIIKKTLNEYNINTSDFKIRQLVIHLILIMKSKENEDTTVSIDSEALEISNICIKEINR
ncbi:HTH domain-containing protein, partial [Staphylococcus devriesei]|uniref:HTH domain-containing protein n=1 Tax=Staphylococcus devriesei TaxID=586733 RepID=UPI000E69FA60